MNKEELIDKKKKFNKYYNIIYILILLAIITDYIAYMITYDTKYYLSGTLFMIISCLESIYVFLVNKDYDNKIKEEYRKERFKFLNQLESHKIDYEE